MAKVEREKIHHFSFKSDIRDVGLYKNSFKMLRKTPSLDLQHINTKSMLTQGVPTVSELDAQHIDTMATLMVYFKLLDDKGQVVQRALANGQLVDSTDWIEDILDDKIQVKLHQDWLEYQQSFYVKPPEAKNESGSGSASV